MTTDSYVQVPPDSTGSKIDTSELTRSDGTVVERQRIVISSPTDPDSFVGVSSGGLELAIKLDEVTGQLKRIARLLELFTGVEVSLSDAE